VNWRLDGEDLSIERRFFRREESAAIMMNAFQNHMSDIQIRKNDSLSIYPYELCAQYGDCLNRWSVNILESGDVITENAGIRFNLSWDELFLKICFKPYGPLVWNTDTMFDYYLTHIILRVGTEYNKEPEYVVLQISNEELKAYQWPTGQGWKNRPIEQKSIKSRQEKDMYICEIPWDTIKMKHVCEGTQLYLDIQAHLTFARERYYVDVCWNAGNCGCMWNEIRDCSYLTNVIIA
jgi:hypothetical protein